MLVTRTPLRIPLGGGGTDLPSYYSRHGGYLLSAAINRYVHIVVNRRFVDSIRVSYSRTEIVDSIEEIRHPIVREALKLLDLHGGLEIVSVADLPANTGLGSSSSFTVGLLNALHTFKHEQVTPQQLAEEAYTIEAERLGEPIGKQDHYVAAFGGVIAMDIERDGTVHVERLALSDSMVDVIEDAIGLYYTGMERRASEVLEEQSQSVSRNEEQVVQAMHRIKELGFRAKEALLAGDMASFGALLHEHWSTKKRLSNKISSTRIDQWYELARENGALGGKIMGAGGGGFFMFCCPNGQKPMLRSALEGHGLRELRYAIEPAGSRVLINL